MMRATCAGVLSAFALGACGGDGAVSCTYDSYGIRSAACYAARVFASRDSALLVPSVGDVDVYRDRWAAVGTAEPLLSSRFPKRSFAGGVELDVLSTTPAVEAAWQAGRVATTILEVDAVLNQIGVVKVISQERADHSGFGYTLEYSRFFNEARLEPILRTEGIEMTDRDLYDHDDGTWSWGSSSAVVTDLHTATASIDFVIGFGDCANGCFGHHSLRAIAPPDGTATVYDMGGDPLPIELALSPSTLPPP